MTSKMTVRYVNLISEYVEPVKTAVRTGKWILQEGKLIPPLAFVNQCGRTWLLTGPVLILESPDEVISRYEAQPMDDLLFVKLHAFKERVAAYRAMNIDALLLRAIETNIYPPGLDPEYGW